jgi:anti-sigma B factor antagonist
VTWFERELNIFDTEGSKTMKTQKQSIAVRTLPEQLDAGHQRALYRELEKCINVDRPALVLDCSRFSRLDEGAIHFLLCCLEEAMKRNGDVRLAALRGETNKVFRSTGLDHLFQTFDSVAEAIESFRLPMMSLDQREPSSANQQPARDNAA